MKMRGKKVDYVEVEIEDSVLKGYVLDSLLGLVGLRGDHSTSYYLSKGNVMRVEDSRHGSDSTYLHRKATDDDIVVFRAIELLWAQKS